jgi:hypothetical protein
MKRWVAATVLALALAVPVAQAAPDPADQGLVGVDPFNSFVVTRILPNQRETVLAALPLEEGWTTSTVVREVALQAARQQRTNNPAWVIIIYGPVDPPFTFWTNQDRVWDSRVDL